MTIRLEIILVTELSVDVGLYYEIPTDIYSPVSEDNSRKPAGKGVKGQDLVALKNGHLYEVLQTVDPTSKTEAEFQAFLENLWYDQKLPAEADYKQKFSYTSIPDLEGGVWDGSVWE